jgi:very-short-patch-repair endonuclease
MAMCGAVVLTHAVPGTSGSDSGEIAMDMKSPAVLLALLAGILLVVALLKASTRNAIERPKRKRVLTEREQAMCNRLMQALPNLHVMPQVAFSALITARTRQARNTFDRKVADFVICDGYYDVVAVIELDDRSHLGNEDRDARRDHLLTAVGYRVIRYPNIPSVARLRSDLEVR